MKYYFEDYYKYCFTVSDEQGNLYDLDGDFCNDGDIYRFDISKEGEAEVVGGGIKIDGLLFKKR